MMSEDEIKSRIEEILSDQRLSYKTARIQINAPLALIQLQLETELHTLQKVIGVQRTNIFELRGE